MTIENVNINDLRDGGIRKLREQVVESMRRYYANQEEGLPVIMQNDPLLSPGEYLGDSDGHAVSAILSTLTNINTVVNSIGSIRTLYKASDWLVMADFDYNGDGRFLGLRLLPMIEKVR